MSGYDGIARRDLAEAFGHCRAALRKLDGASMFITGGTGFFGRWLLALLAHARSEIRIDVTVLTRDPDHFRRNYPELAAQDFIALKRGDVRWFEFPKGRFTHVIHAATDTSVAADNDAATLMSSIVDGARTRARIRRQRRRSAPAPRQLRRRLRAAAVRHARTRGGLSRRA
jgi:hypothetical protein